ncbi:MAG: thioester reductase domain-containing protein [Bdellovibrionales bacterium]|nr:thioester reductase domain-containing protein [Bdellovibrionales bacterium]
MNQNLTATDQLSKIRAVFLTGATGVLGTQLLKQLLLEYSMPIFCLVRAENEEQGLGRLRSLLKAYDPNGECEEQFASRLVPVLGDVSQENLGLSLPRYLELAQKVDLTIHAAADTNLFSNFRRIEKVNVGGTRHMIDFALQTPTKDLCYVSTYTVMGDKTFDANTVFRETDLDIGQEFAHMSYQKSKFIAENLVREAGDTRGLVWNIVRPGQIYGESTTGHYPQGQTNVSGLFYDIFKTVVETGIAFRSQSHFDITPVDYVSRGILYLSLNRSQRFETFHLTNPDIKSYVAIVEILASLGYNINFVSQEEYKAMLKDRQLKVDGVEYASITTKAFRWWFKHGQFNFEQGAVTDCARTVSILREGGVNCPQIDQKLMGTYVARAVSLGYMPAPEQGSL